MRAYLTGCFLFASSAVQACPQGATTLVSCTLEGGAKYLETCLLGDHATYAFGKTGRRADLALARHVRDVDMTPWPGIGRYIWEEFVFVNGDASYQVFYSIDKLAENGSQFSAGVTPLLFGEGHHSLDCDPGSIETAGYSLPLFEAKEAAGQVYSLDTRSWQ